MTHSAEQEQPIRLREFLSLLWVNFLVFYRNTLEFFKVAFRYYGCTQFLKADIALRLMYLFHNPYSISKRFLMKRGVKDVHAYGETPLTTLEAIAKASEIGPQDCVYELGAGRGRGCFWLSSFIGCSVVGVDYVPEFIERGHLIVKRMGLSKIDFRQGDFCEINLNDATVCYLYGTCLEDDVIKKLVEKFSRLKPGTKIITVSYSLVEYSGKPFFEITKHFKGKYTWGEADIYVQVIKT